MDKPAATKTRRQTVSDTDPDWMRFWAAYPRRTGKGAARNAWAKALTKVDGPDVLIDAATSFAKAKDRDSEFTPHPATWLNQERWLDETEKPTSSGRWAPVKAGSPEECKTHVGEHKDRCRMCASERIAVPD